MALAVAAQKPPHLRAIVPIYGSADLYQDFIAPGGCRICLGTLGWVSMGLTLDLAPPSFLDQDGRWDTVWRERLERLRRGDICPLEWQHHDEDDPYWHRMAIPVEQIETPALVVGGWRDIFPQAMPDAYERMRGPKKLLMGPWVSIPAGLMLFPVPRTILRSRCAAFSKSLVEGRRQRGDGGAGSDPVRPRRRKSGSTSARIADCANRSSCMATAPHIQAAVSRRRTSARLGRRRRRTPTPPTQSVGTASALTTICSGWGSGHPLEQAEDDLRSLTYTTEPLDDELEITGLVRSVVACRAGRRQAPSVGCEAQRCVP